MYIYIMSFLFKAARLCPLDLNQAETRSRSQPFGLSYQSPLLPHSERSSRSSSMETEGQQRSRASFDPVLEFCQGHPGVPERSRHVVGGFTHSCFWYFTVFNTDNVNSHYRSIMLYIYIYVKKWKKDKYY